MAHHMKIVIRVQFAGDDPDLIPDPNDVRQRVDSALRKSEIIAKRYEAEVEEYDVEVEDLGQS